MSAYSPIYVSSTENSPASTPASSRESSPTITEWVHNPEPSVPDPLPFQKEIDDWVGFTNPRPTSEEVRIFIRNVGLLFQFAGTAERDRMNEWREERLEVCASYFLSTHRLILF